MKDAGLSLAVVLAVILAALSTIGAFRVCYPFQNSDTLYPVLFARDLDAGGALRSWVITPAPSYVDLAVVWGLGHCTSTLRGIFAGWAGLVSLAMLGGSALVHRAAGWSRRHALLFAALGVAAFFGGVHEPTGARGAFFFPTVHSVPVYLLLAAGAAIARAATRKRLRIAVLGGLVVGALASGDALFIPQVLGPLALLTLAARWKRAFERPLRRALTAFSIACVGALLVTTGVLRAVGPSVPGRTFEVTPPLILAGLRQLWLYVRHALVHELNGIGLALWFAWLVVALVFLVRRAVRRQPLGPEAFVTAFGFLAAVASIAAAIVLGTWSDVPIPRYALPTLIAPFLFLAVPSRGAGRALGLGALVAALGSGLPWPLPPKVDAFTNPLPATLTDHVRTLARTGVPIGMARYWDGKRLMIDAPGARVSHFDFDYTLRLADWITSGDWLFELRPNGKLVLPERFFTVEQADNDDPVTYDWGRVETTETAAGYRLQVLHVHPAGYARAVRGMCDQMAIDRGTLCAPWRGRTSLLPLLAAADDQPAFVSDYTLTRPLHDVLKVPPGRYRLRVWLDGPAGALAVTIADPTSGASIVTSSALADGGLEVRARASSAGLALELGASTPVHLWDVRLYGD